ncbi:MAG: hypothetical protein JJD96_00640 [Thermoleophilia bacterium]|nr:hypothetical protein [Thermoleophilia bacterium]
MRHTVLRWILILVATTVVGLTAVTIIGCASGDTPSQVVEKYYQATQDNNCEAVPDLVVSGRPKVLDNYVNSCKRYAGKLVSYSIKGERFEYDGRLAGVDTEVTLKDDNGVETTKSVGQTLAETDDGWKLTKLENRD